MTTRKKNPRPVSPEQSERKRSFPPVVDARTRLLILGSLPGEASLAQAQYYANPQNRFWRLLSEVIAFDLVPLAYEARLQSLLQHGIGLWDAVAEAERSGSLDSRIRARDDNDLRGLVSSLPHLATIAFNGGTAARIGLKTLGDLAARYDVVQLPSSSPAYTLAYAEKLAAWLVLKKVVKVA